MSGMVKYRSGSPSRSKRRSRGLHWPFGNDIDLFEELTDFNRSMFGLIPQYFEYATPRLNMKDEGDQYVIEVDAPGYAEDNLEITLDGRQMTLRGEIKEEKKDEDKEGKYLIQEVSHRKFVRTLNLPEEANTDAVVANLKDGVLKLEVPKHEKSLGPKKVEINK